ncbi:kinetochore protein NDC80 homolog [Pogonomyrmex barbatus]|uniref:Kinetochore protein NDC80 n=1 Tax=Pogonomyrmex barbatus TaxID=144034 RepID=A0A6I9W9X4_9HYME|nr:kinetochore protein NDC80 homolog [Pogonomyrmex barbatus]
MHSMKRRSSSNPVRISAIEREDKSLPRTDQRKTQTVNSKKSIVETSHIPRSRFRSFSNDRAGSLGRKSYLKTTTGRTQLSTTPITPRLTKFTTNLVSTASLSRSHSPLSIGRSPSGDRASGVSAKGPKKDTRPLNDKDYRIVLLNKIDDFFSILSVKSNQLPMLNSNGSLKPITSKMFVEVSGFLLRFFFNIKHDLTTTNYIEELPKYAKKLHYPGVMTKSWLRTVSAMHSWPYVLGWIGWLVEVCQVREIAFDTYKLETLPFIGTEQETQRYNLEFQTLLKCYKAWNDEKHDEEAELLEEYLQNISVQQGVTDDDIIQAREELKKEEVKLQMLKEESQKVDKKVEQLQQKLAFLHARETEQLNDIETMENCIKTFSAETNQLNTEYKTLDEQIRIGNVQLEQLRSTVKNQAISKRQKEDIIKECTERQNYMHQFDEHLKDYEKKTYTLDMQLTSLSNNLNKAILAYNKEVFMHTDNDIINFDELKLPEKGLLEPQIMDVMKEKTSLIIKIKEILTKKLNEIESLICSETVKLEKLQEKVKFLLDGHNALKDEISHIDEMKENMKKEKVKFTKQIEDLRNEIKEMQNMMPDIKAIDLEIEEAQDKLDAVIRRKTYLEQTAKRFFEEFYKSVGYHREELYKILTRDRTK